LAEVLFNDTSVRPGVITRFLDRAARLHSVLSTTTPLAAYPLLMEAPFPQHLFTALALAVKQYIYLALSVAFPDESFDLDADLLIAYKRQILALPNITPNGLLLPKRETYLGYNLLHRHLVPIIRTFGFEPHVRSIHLPVNVRIVHGVPAPKIDSRPRASVKPHSDVWAGEPTNAIMIFLPVFGDLNRVGIDFFEPPEAFARYIRPLDNFDEGAHLLAGATQYDCRLRAGCAYFIDPYTLHRTVKQRDALRLSIDFRFLPHEWLASDVAFATERKENYVSLQEWYEVGEKQLLVSDSALDEIHTNGKEPDGKVRNAYAAAFRTVVP
jgi:hypothetical protein